MCGPEPYHNLALQPHEGEEREIAVGAARCRIDDHEELLAPRYHRGRCGTEEGVDVRSAEALLQRVEGQPAEFGLDEVRTVRHHRLKALMSRRRLPSRHEVEHVLALGREAGILARVAGEGDLQLCKDGKTRNGILDLEQTGVEAVRISNQYAAEEEEDFKRALT